MTSRPGREVRASASTSSGGAPPRASPPAASSCRFRTRGSRPPSAREDGRCARGRSVGCSPSPDRRSRPSRKVRRRRRPPRARPARERRPRPRPGRPSSRRRPACRGRAVRTRGRPSPAGRRADGLRRLRGQSGGAIRIARDGDPVAGVESRRDPLPRAVSAEGEGLVAETGEPERPALFVHFGRDLAAAPEGGPSANQASRPAEVSNSARSGVKTVIRPVRAASGDESAERAGTAATPTYCPSRFSGPPKRSAPDPSPSTSTQAR